MFFRFTLSLVGGLLIVPAIQAQSPVKPRTDALGDPLPEGASARLGTVRLKHDPAFGQIVDVARFSPDGTKIVSLLYNNGSMCLWDAASGKEIRGPWSSPSDQRYNPMQRFTAAAFSPDGTLLAAALSRFRRVAVNKKNAQGEIILYEIASAKAVKSLFYDLGAARPANTIVGQHDVHALAFADGGKTLVAAGQGTVRWFDVATGKEQRSWKPFPDEKKKVDGAPQTKTFHNCAIAPNGAAIAVQAAWQLENNARFANQRYEPIEHEAVGYNLATRKMTWRSTGKAYPYEMGRFAFSGDSKRIAAAMDASKVEVRDSATGKLIANPVGAELLGTGRLGSQARGMGRLGSLALSSDGRLAALSSVEAKIVLWNTDDARAPAKLLPRQFVTRIGQQFPYSQACLHFSADDKTLLVGADFDLQRYDVATLQEVRPSDGHRGWVDTLAFTADGKRLLTGSAELNFSPQETAVWDVATWKRLQVTSAASPAWPNLAVACPEQSVYVGKTGDDRFSFFDLKSGKLLARLNAPKVQAVPGGGFFSPSGKLYVLRGSDNERVYAVPSGKLVARLPPIAVAQQRGQAARPIAFSFDERLVALFGRGDGRFNGQSDGVIQICDMATGKVRQRLGTKSEQQDGYYYAITDSLAFSKDGKLLASRKIPENVIRVWDVATGVELTQFVPEETKNPGQPYNQGQICFAWSPDSRLLAVGVNKIHLWELATHGVRHDLPGHQGAPVRALAFSTHGRILASGSADTTVLIWDIATATGARDHKALSAGDLAKRWQTLAEDDAAKAGAAIGDFAAVPAESVAWIKEKIKPASRLDAKYVEGLIAQLDDSKYTVRQKASVEILHIGERVLPAIDKALAGKPSLETHRRLQDARKRLSGLVLKGERLQIYRAVEVLERIGTAEARRALQTLADGAPAALVTVQSQLALARLER